jgi:hypothetical protein
MINKKLKDLRTAARRLTRWEASHQAFGHLETITKDDSLFEFYCYMRMLTDLKHNYHIEFIKGAPGNVFPKGPAKKEGKPRFHINHKATSKKYQLCYGTTIRLSNCAPTTHAPDISLQDISASEDPTEIDVQVIWDAKYKEKESSLGVSLLREFAMNVVDFRLQIAPSTPLAFRHLTSFNTNCLITNGTISDRHEQYCTDRIIRQIGSFQKGYHLMQTVG